MIRAVVSFMALLAATVAVAEPKVSDGGTPPAGDPSAQQKAAAEQSRRDEAKKALNALKGASKDKTDKRDERKPGGR